LFLNFHPWWLVFLAQEIISKVLMHLSYSKKKKKSCTADSRALSVIYTVCIFKTGHFCNWLLAPNAHMAPGKELYKLRVMEILAKEMK
jgi:hypothetical protein